MCCVVSTIFFLGPRAGLLIWWLINPARFAMVYSTLIIPILGAIFLPVTTLTYTFIYHPGVPVGLDWLWLAIALIIDLSLYGGGAVSRRRRY